MVGAQIHFPIAARIAGRALQVDATIRDPQPVDTERGRWSGRGNGGGCRRRAGTEMGEVPLAGTILQLDQPVGRLLQDHAKQVRLGGNLVQVRAAVQSFSGWSAHADRDGLLDFAQMTQPRTKTIFTALGEPSAARFLAQRIHGFLGARAIVPTEGETWEITKGSVTKISK